MNVNDDVDPIETIEWVDALRAVAQHRGPQRTNHIVNRLVDLARNDGVYVPRR